MDMLNTKQAAELWGISERRVSGLCKENKIAGAVKQGRSWLIPSNTPVPADKRVKTGAYVKKKASLLPLPIGVSDYRTASVKYYYVDKTLMIKDIIDEQALVSLYTRPRRFGKTLNMNMLRTFFEKTDEDTSVYFRNKNIWQCGKKYQDHQGKYPVIYITFKDIKFETWNDSFESVKNIFRQEAYRHEILRKSDKCNDYEKEYFEKILSGKANELELSSFFLVLSGMLNKHYKIPPVIIIDEYDIPIQQGYMSGYYDQVIRFMRNLFSGAFKDNQNLSFGFLTGILRVAKESIFSGLNNLTVNSVLTNKYSEYFGFTKEEVKAMSAYYGAVEKYSEICEWYDGYQFGKTEIFNPWSVINYFNNGCEPDAYWQSTGSNEIIGEIIAEAGPDICDKMTALLNGQSLTAYIDTGVIYPQIRKNPSSIFSFLLVAGYLKAKKSLPSISGGYLCEVALPNKEIVFVYNKEVLQKLESMISFSSSTAIQEALFSGDEEKLKNEIQQVLTRSVSYYDASNESFYHGFILGLCSLFNEFYITSNRESGDGRFDIQLFPKNNKMPGILLELKFANEQSSKDLKELAWEALNQIIDRRYAAEMLEKGISPVYCYGAAFKGKNVETAFSAAQ